MPESAARPDQRLSQIAAAFSLNVFRRYVRYARLLDWKFLSIAYTPI